MRKLRLLIVSALIAAASLITGSPRAHAADAVEQRFLDPGPWWVSSYWGPGGGCGSGQNPVGDFSYVYPTFLGSYDVDHAIIVWGNGSSTAANASCSYQTVLNHFASWGFVVVVANTGNPGNGGEMLDGLDTLIAANSDPLSAFYQKLDTTSIAAAGHSQGAVGAVNAAVDDTGIIDSVLAISIPDFEDVTFFNDNLCSAPCVDVDVPSQSQINNMGSTVFYARGTGVHNMQGLCSIDDWMADKTAQDWYPDVPSFPFAAATVKVDQPDPYTNCNPLLPYPHFDPFSNGLGYMTAWLHYSLWDDVVPEAAPAFTGSPAEISTNSNWQGITLQNLP